jgi:uncharacterized protein
MRKYFRISIYLFVVFGFVSASANTYVDYFRAVELDNVDKVSKLLSKGFDPNTVSESGQTGLYLAMREGSSKVAAVLLASPDIKIDAANRTGETALMMAALRGRFDWTQRLVEHGAKVQKDGWSPIHYAAAGPNVQVVALLLDRGANIDALAPDKSTPLMMAARHGPEESVRLLVQRGANRKLLNERNQSAADLASHAGRSWLLPMLE